MATDANSIFAAALPEPYVVLGLKLRPFSLGHYITLRRHGCAFVEPDKANATHDDLIFACLVCSMSWEEFASWTESRPIPWTRRAKELLSCRTRVEALAAFAGNQCTLDVLRWGRKVGLFSLSEKAALFQRYLDYHSAIPKYWDEGQNTKCTGVDWPQAVFLTLTGALNFTRTEALNMPLREAFMHVFAHADSLGVVRLMTSEELDLVNGPQSIS